MVYDILLLYVGKHVGIENTWYYILLGFMAFIHLISFGINLYNKGLEKGKNDS